MANVRTSRIRRLLALSLVAAVATACGSNGGGATGQTSTTQTGDASFSAAAGMATTAAPGALSTDARIDPSTSAVTAASSTLTEQPSTAGAPTAPAATQAVPPGGYATVITDEVVANPAFAPLKADIVQRLEAVGLPGASLLVVHDGVLVEQETFLTYTLDTRVPIASASKWLSAAVLMTLVDDGTLALDEPISTYIPELKGAKPGLITLRHLLSFTSGLIADAKVPCLQTGDLDLQGCAAEVLRKGVVHPPGAAFRYGSQHLHVAGALAERVTAKPFQQLFVERVARPLGMGDTFFAQHARGRDVQPEDVDHPLPAGSGVSTLGDYGRFLEMIAHDGVAPDGTQILRAESIVEMRTNQTEDVEGYSASEFRRNFRAPYGLGQWIDWTDAQGNTMVVSSDGAFGFRPWIDLANDLYGVYLILDQDKGYSEGDPDASAEDAKKVHTSGLWVMSGSAEAVGGSLPERYYAHRS